MSIGWLWADTNCIDKTSSAELSEAINSMYRWYEDSRICLAYLSDVLSKDLSPSDVSEAFRASRWFTRGWTLQELLAPSRVLFFDAKWHSIGGKDDRAREISQITGVAEEILTGKVSATRASVAQKMSWLAKRMTTRLEDIAYCMLGIFDINMPLLYGEGMKAFTRLQEEIIKTSNDHTIFCWNWTTSVPSDWGSMLAPSPDAFYDAEAFTPRDARHPIFAELSTYHMTNAGLSIRLPLFRTPRFYFCVLNVRVLDTTRYPDPNPGWYMPCIALVGETRGSSMRLRRVAFPSRPAVVDISKFGPENVPQRDIFVVPRYNPATQDFIVSGTNAVGAIMDSKISALRQAAHSRLGRPPIPKFWNTAGRGEDYGVLLAMDPATQGRLSDKSQFTPGSDHVITQSSGQIVSDERWGRFDVRWGLFRLSKCEEYPSVFGCIFSLGRHPNKTRHDARVEEFALFIAVRVVPPEATTGTNVQLFSQIYTMQKEPAELGSDWEQKLEIRQNWYSGLIGEFASNCAWDGRDQRSFQHDGLGMSAAFGHAELAPFGQYKRIWLLQMWSTPKRPAVPRLEVPGKEASTKRLSLSPNWRENWKGLLH